MSAVNGFENLMITVYGADWCEDTRRSLRHLRRLAIAHDYVNIDDDADALARAKALNGGARRTPTIDLGMGGPALVEPDNDTLSAALVEVQMLTRWRMSTSGSGFRTSATSSACCASAPGRRSCWRPAPDPDRVRWPLRLAGAVAALTGFAGWCPLYHVSGVSSLQGPGDRPDETTRDAWLIRRTSVRGAAVADGADAVKEAATEVLISDYDLYLFGEGKHTRIYEKLGAHPLTRRRCCRLSLRGVGPQRPARQRRRRLQPLAGGHASTGSARGERDLGRIRSAAAPSGIDTSSNCSPGPAPGC